MTHSLSFVWNPTEGIDLGFFVIRYYSLMFVIAFGLGFYIMKKIFIRENESIEKLDSLFVYTVLATLLGARLGHVFFYDWDDFKNRPIEILLPIKAQEGSTLFGFIDGYQFTGFTGLASHGAAIGIIFTMYFFSKKIMKRPILWVLDRVVIPVASGAVFVRLGNFFNSEIYGNPTSGKNFFAVKFVHDDEFWRTRNLEEITATNSAKEGYNAIANNPKFSEILNQIPFRHPAQLYEAFFYVFVFLILYFAYWKTNIREKQGVLLGWFLIMLWTVRFFVENVKASQGGFEESWTYFTTGQWLSIPFIIVGLILVINNGKHLKVLDK
jgi:phosphatidylglycerol---prolipoprotein diacylglyceryl transferase